jgi:hypothetical protein
MSTTTPEQPLWGYWRAADQCRHCGFIAQRMVVHSYTCPVCGVHDSSPRPVAYRYKQRVILGFSFDTPEIEVKDAAPPPPKKSLI